LKKLLTREVISLDRIYFADLREKKQV